MIAGYQRCSDRSRSSSPTLHIGFIK